MNENCKDICVVFDVDGTLFDTKDGILRAIREVSEKFGCRKITDADELSFIGPPIKETFMTHFGMDKATAGRATAEYRKIYVQKHITESQLYDGMAEVLDELRGHGMQIAIATMKTGKQAATLLENFSMKDSFDMIETAADDGGKTKAGMISAITTRLKIENNNVWMVGDTKGDYEAAKEACVRFIGVTYGYGFNKDGEYPFAVAEKPEEILNIIKGGIVNEQDKGAGLYFKRRRILQ